MLKPEREKYRGSVKASMLPVRKQEGRDEQEAQQDINSYGNIIGVR